GAADPFRVDVVTDFGDHPAQLVAERDAGFDRVLAAGDVEVGAADAGGRDLDDDVAGGRDGLGPLDHRHLPGTGTLLDEATHRQRSDCIPNSLPGAPVCALQPCLRRSSPRLDPIMGKARVDSLDAALLVEQLAVAGQAPPAPLQRVAELFFADPLVPV